MQCVILAGGLATRMRPITESIPKSLIPVRGRPFIDYQLWWMHRQGVTKVVLCIGYKGERIRAYLAQRSQPLEISFVDEGEVLLGTAGALRLAYDCGVLDEKFLLTYGDSFLPVNFGGVWRHFLSQNQPAMMSVFRNQGKWDTSNACYRDGQVSLYEKKGTKATEVPLEYIDYGLSALSRSVIEQCIPGSQKMDLALLFNRLSLAGQLGGYEVDTRFYEIGSLDGLHDFSKFVDDKLPDFLNYSQSEQIELKGVQPYGRNRNQNQNFLGRSRFEIDAGDVQKPDDRGIDY